VIGRGDFNVITINAINYRSFSPSIFFALAIVVLMGSPVAHADTSKGISEIILKVVKRGNFWYRIVDTGAEVVLTTKEVSELNLSNTETAGMVIEIVTSNAWTQIKKDASELSEAGEYLANDVVIPAAVEGMDYTRDTIVPASKKFISETYDSTAPVVKESAGNLKNWAVETWKNW